MQDLETRVSLLPRKGVPNVPRRTRTKNPTKTTMCQTGSTSLMMVRFGRFGGIGAGMYARRESMAVCEVCVCMFRCATHFPSRVCHHILISSSPRCILHYVLTQNLHCIAIPVVPDCSTSVSFAEVRRASLPEVMKRQAYILFYTRMRPPKRSPARASPAPGSSNTSSRSSPTADMEGSGSEHRGT